MTAPRRHSELPFTDLRQAEYFLAVVDNGGITPAAESLRVAQPSLSQAIRVIERRAGVPLFTRMPRGAVPTEAGAALVEPARRLLRARASAREAVADVAALRTGRLELVAHASVTADPLALAIGVFLRAHPGMDVLVENAQDDEELVYALTDGRHELAVTYLPLPQTSSLVSEELGCHDIWLAAAPGTRLDPGPFPLADVNALPLVAVMHGGSARRAVRQALAEAERHLTGADTAGTPRAWAGVVTPQLGSVIPLVLAGAGAALVDRWYAERIAELGGVVRPLEPRVRCPFGVSHRKEPLSPASHAFLDVLRDVCAARPDRSPR
ncbi:DNA-binding transcriptional regulator, LysR family [Streptoalloteichus tenebrarius]|uniref:DNA-binding transcriptional regulator, LysR family n=1 Tax=Streptoalloteichus tenebrarius (strain ATCC 17920 / DSM 40477 / JCM 4838 / CBS 697.72 / NBRC 16177 / NCIMB 11028 / NRRL B-12390 / A12253. 1 / ISP 5477) TaxID=1933 RepID=A0ABT1HWE3_STRSD|nr:LysR family transcriptional regulator [Streptoalloteichus tenebrarius]MCP2259840.1 DNA-binding transcriptional regulator, LysR family [Streptoalloteichus tenebrarius]BFE99210.1 LysR substrate-binding domain-containing protein [Streptoalloteichus tenebrarius]